MRIKVYCHGFKFKRPGEITAWHSLRFNVRLPVTLLSSNYALSCSRAVAKMAQPTAEPVEDYEYVAAAPARERAGALLHRPERH